MTSKFKFHGQAVPEAFRFLDPDEDIAEGIAGGFNTLHFNKQLFSLKYRGKWYPIMREDGSQTNTIDLIILAVSPYVSKVYYPGPYQGEASRGRRPLCKSTQGDKPDSDAEIPQNPTCNGCIQDQWRKGGGGKPCQDHKRVAVLLLPSLTTQLLGAPLLEPIGFKIPPGSFGTWKEYAAKIKHEGYPIASLITRVSFDPEKQYCMTFEEMQVLTSQEAGLIRDLRGGAQTERIIGTDSGVRKLQHAPQAPERINTGLIEGFTQAATPKTNATDALAAGATVTMHGQGGGGGKVRAVRNEVNGHGEGLAVPGYPERAPKKEPTQTVESSSDLDEDVARMLDKKVEEMLK